MLCYFSLSTLHYTLLTVVKMINDHVICGSTPFYSDCLHVCWGGDSGGYIGLEVGTVVRLVILGLEAETVV